MTAADVKDALRRRHPGAPGGGMPGEWTCIEEWMGIDLLAIRAWGAGQRVGYEVKVSRSDYRRELLRPHKRQRAVDVCHEFYFAVPEGLLKPEEIAYKESLWEDGDFERVRCPARCETVGRNRGIYSNVHYTPRRGTVEPAAVPVPVVLPERQRNPWWENERYSDEQRAHFEEQAIQTALRHSGWTHIACRECEGKGFIRGSRVEREAPQLWIPNDVGLIEVTARGCRVTRRAPKRTAQPLVHSDKSLGLLVRWVSMRPDPRHVQPAALPLDEERAA